MYCDYDTFGSKMQKEIYYSNLLEGKSIVVSGVFLKKSRTEIKMLIEKKLRLQVHFLGLL